MYDVLIPMGNADVPLPMFIPQLWVVFLQLLYDIDKNALR
jgi:hypothetical protein